MLLGEIQKNSTEKIRVTLSEYKGYQFIDIRVYFEADNGEWKPTKKGIAISPDKIDEIISLLKEAKNKGGKTND